MHIGFRQLLPLLLILILVQCMGCSVAHRQAAQQDPFIALRMSGLSAGSPEQGDFDAEYNDEDGQMIADPLKPWNVVWFYFNDAFYQVVRPTAVAYNYVVPEPARKGVDNFFYNAKFPIRFVNCLLQGKLLAAGVEFSRFFGNTLFGGLGFMDITEYKKAAAPTPPEDFGQTLGVWGVDNGFYLVLPIFGPSTLRDGVGMGVDYFLDPLTYLDPLVPQLACRLVDSHLGIRHTGIHQRGQGG